MVYLRKLESNPASVIDYSFSNSVNFPLVSSDLILDMLTTIPTST